MELLVDGHPGAHETWQELADHSLTHDQVPGTPGGGPVQLPSENEVTHE